MVTPDFEDWLRRQDMPIEATTDIDKYLDYLAVELGISGGSLDVAEDIYRERYDYMTQLGITPFEWTREYEGEPFTETRYGIEGLRGAFGLERMTEIAEERAEERGEYEAAKWFRTKREER